MHVFPILVLTLHIKHELMYRPAASSLLPWVGSDEHRIVGMTQLADI